VLIMLGPQRLRDLGEPMVVAQLAGPGLVAGFPPLRGVAGGDRSSLPAATSSLIGREEEVDRLVARLADARLITVTGPGGTGKTRVALEAARRLGPTLADGAHLVELSPVTEPTRVPDAVAAALRVRPLADQTVMDALRLHLAEREILLVVDTLEHLLPEAAPSIAALLACAPAVRVLATSRVPVGLPGEVRLPLEPLDPHDAGARLFVERARAVDASFDAEGAGWESVVELCRRLDGLPLAIELAAARVTLASPSRLMDLMPVGLDLAAGHMVGLGPRQRTLRATLAWSVDLLPAEAVAGFAALGAFVGSFDLAAGSAVVAGVVADPLGLVVSLLDNSLLVRRSVDDRGEPRFGYLDTVREYALERLTADPDAHRAALQRHAAWFAGVADQARDDIDRSHARRDLASFVRDMAEIEAAIERMGEVGDGDLACSMAADLADNQEIRGGRHRGLALLERSLRSTAPGVPRARASNALGMHLQRLGDGRAEAVLLDARAIALDTGALAVAADAEMNLANVAMFAGRMDETNAWLLSSEARWMAAGDPQTVHRWSPRGGLANETLVADLPSRLQVMHEGVAYAMALGNDHLLDIVHFNLGEVEREIGDLDRSLASCRTAVRHAAAIESVDGLLDDLESVAGTLMALGAWEAGTTIMAGCAAIRTGRSERPKWSTTGPVTIDWRRAAMAALGQEAWDRVMVEAPRLTLDELVRLALEAPAPTAEIAEPRG